jgi:hypothetical protein
MLGLARPCGTHLDPELHRRWHTHLCGVCLTLRDTAGHAARAVTNTDAVLLSVLVEAQQTGEPATRTAGPCALRRMASAEVIAPDELSVRLGATAALTLAAAKMGDRIGEFQSGLAGDRTGRGTVVLLRRTERYLRCRAVADRPVAGAAQVSDVLEGLGKQAGIELTAKQLSEVTAPTASATAAVFAASARLAGRPENAAALEAVGRDYGEFAHLADAVQDLRRDRGCGSYNPLDATDTPKEIAVERMRELRARALRSLDRVQTRDARLARAVLDSAMGAVLAAQANSDPAGTDGGAGGRGKKKRSTEARRSAGPDLTDRSDCFYCCAGGESCCGGDCSCAADD